MPIKIDESTFYNYSEKYNLFRSQYLGKEVKIKYKINGSKQEKSGTLEEISFSGVMLRQENNLTVLPYSLKLEIDSF